MKSSLALKSYGRHTKLVRKFLCAVLCALTVICVVSVQGQDVPSVTREYYPQVISHQLQRIAESSAAEVLPLQDICLAILDDLHTIVANLEHNPMKPCHELQRLEESLLVWEAHRESWTPTVSHHHDDCSYVPTITALEEISLALQRRIYIWKSLLNAEYAEASPIVTLYEKSFADIIRLKERTLAVEQYFTKSPRRVAEYQAGLSWCDYLETQSWITELEACQQPAGQQIRRVSLPSTPAIPVEILKTFGNRANTTVYRLESPTLTGEQRRFLNHPVVKTWKEELESWRVDTVTPINILGHVEQYETTGGMSDMKALSRFIDQLSLSKTAEYRQLGANVRLQYGMANTRLFLSNALLNNHLPPQEAEIASFRDVILSQPTVGRRQTETDYKITFVPHPTRVLTSLDVEVDLATVSRSDAFATQLFNTGRTRVEATKTIEFTEKGFIAEPCKAQIVAHRMKLVRINTEFDSMPLVSGLFRNAVLNQYESRAAEARTETQRKILRQVRSQVDREIEKRLKPLNERLRTLSQYADEDFGLHVEKRESRTDENWLLSAWGICGKDTLTSHTPPPETLPGSFADLKIHESLPNILLGKLEFEGMRGTVGEFKTMLAEKLKQPGLASPDENDHVDVTFAPYNPMVVRFVGGHIELTVSIAALRLLGKTHRDFQAIVRYKPAYDEEGRLVLERDSYISLINVREQFVMRTVFGKIFPVSRPFPLVPNVLENESQYDYLTVGNCRIEKGWFALALVQKGNE